MLNTQNSLYKNNINTPLGSLIVIANESALFFLAFADSKNLNANIMRLQRQTRAIIKDGMTAPIQSIQNELTQYFENEKNAFNTPLTLTGTDFQKKVWRALMTIPHGETKSYADIAKAIGHPTAYRAVAQANAANFLPIIIPCHRVINSSGKMGGYNCGLSRKSWLLNHENIVARDEH